MSTHNGRAIHPQLHRIPNHEERIDTILGIVYRREGYDVVEGYTPLDALFDAETPRDEPDSVLEFEQKMERRRQLKTMMGIFFEDGPHPGHVVRRVYVIAVNLFPELVLNMSQTDIANMLGETKGAHSARVKKVCSDYLKKKGAKGFKGASQKSETACSSYSARAKGNTNRRGTGHKLVRPDGTKGGIHYDGY